MLRLILHCTRSRSKISGDTIPKFSSIVQLNSFIPRDNLLFSFWFEVTAKSFSTDWFIPLVRIQNADRIQPLFWIWVALGLSVTFGQCVGACQGTGSPCCKPVGPAAPWWCSGLNKLHVCRSVMEAQHHPSSKKAGAPFFWFNIPF